MVCMAIMVKISYLSTPLGFMKKKMVDGDREGRCELRKALIVSQPADCVLKFLFLLARGVADGDWEKRMQDGQCV